MRAFFSGARLGCAALVVAALCGCSEPEPIAPWAQRYGGLETVVTAKLATDSIGRVALAGGFTGSVDFGGGEFATSGGDTDVFIAVLDERGEPVWSGSTGNHADQAAAGVALDDEGGVVVAGDFRGGIDFGDGVLETQARDSFVAGFDPAGEASWSVQSTNSSSTMRGLAQGGFGSTVVAGEFSYNLTFGAEFEGGYQNAFVGKVGSRGENQWTLVFGGSDHEVAGVATPPDGDVIVAGTNGALISLGSSAFETNYYSGFVARLGSAGNIGWLVQLDGNGPSWVHAVAADAQGNALVTGVFQYALFVGQASITSNLEQAAFVLKLDPEGNPVWLRGLEGDIDPVAIAVDASNDVYLTGSYLGNPDLGGGALRFRDARGVFVASFDAGGEHRSSDDYGELGMASFATSIAATPEGDVLLAGTFAGHMDLGPGLDSVGEQDLFVARLAKAGP